MKKQQKILLLDSDKSYVVPLQNKLTDAGFEVVCLDDGQKALDLAKNQKPDLVISEVDLPQMSGYDLLKQLRSIPTYKITPFIFLSSQKKVDERIKNIELGIDDYITKPFYVEEVIARAKNLLDEISGQNDNKIESEKGFSGSLTEMNLVDLIQTLELGKKSAIIKLKHNSSVGSVQISNGSVVDALLDKLTPEQAIMRMFTWTTGKFYVDITSINKENKLSKTNKDLIEIGIRRINNWEQIVQGLPPLNAIIIKTNNNGYNNLNEDEKAMLTEIDKKVILGDVIEKSKFDDLKALEIVRSLHQKGYLQETEDNYSHYVDDYLQRLKQNTSHSKSPSERAVSIVSNLFEKSEDEQRILERRRLDRRLIPDRRRGGRRRYDHLQDSNYIYLTRTELLMIREALL